ELRIGTSGNRALVADDFLDEARRTGMPFVRRFEMADAHYMVQVPLATGAVVTGVVPPLRGTAADAPLGPLRGVQGDAGRDPLTLVPLLPGDPVPEAPPRWIATDDGWRAERVVDFPDATYHAHWAVDLSGPLLLAARGTL